MTTAATDSGSRADNHSAIEPPIENPTTPIGAVGSSATDRSAWADESTMPDNSSGLSSASVCCPSSAVVGFAPSMRSGAITV